MTNRPRRIATSLRLTSDTHYYLRELRKRTGTNRQSTIDRLVYEEARRLGIPPPPEEPQADKQG